MKPKLVAEYVDTGKARYVLKHFPFVGDESQYAAEGTECAAEQDAFWEYVDIIFANWGGANSGTFLPDRLKGYAGDIGLDQGAFDACLDAGRYKATVLADRDEAVAAGIRATPTIVINGHIIGTPHDYDELKAEIEARLAGQ